MYLIISTESRIILFYDSLRNLYLTPDIEFPNDYLSDLPPAIFYCKETDVVHFIGGSSNDGRDYIQFDLKTLLFVRHCPQLPFGIYGASATCDKITGRIYVFGGCSYSNNTAIDLFMYLDPLLMNWVVCNPMPGIF